LLVPQARAIGRELVGEQDAILREVPSMRTASSIPPRPSA
jgi:hypothetical protein